MFTLTERTCLDVTKERIVPCGSPEAAFLLGGEGAEIEDEQATKLGLIGNKNASTDETEDKSGARGKKR